MRWSGVGWAMLLGLIWPGPSRAGEAKPWTVRVSAGGAALQHGGKRAATIAPGLFEAGWRGGRRTAAVETTVDDGTLVVPLNVAGPDGARMIYRGGGRLKCWRSEVHVGLRSL